METMSLSIVFRCTILKHEDRIVVCIFIGAKSELTFLGHLNVTFVSFHPRPLAQARSPMGVSAVKAAREYYVVQHAYAERCDEENNIDCNQHDDEMELHLNEERGASRDALNKAVDCECWCCVLSGK